MFVIEKLVEFPWVLIFYLWNFHQQGQGFHSLRKVGEFGKGSGKVRKVRIFGKQKSQEKVNKVFIHANF